MFLELHAVAWDRDQLVSIDDRTEALKVRCKFLKLMLPLDDDSLALVSGGFACQMQQQTITSHFCFFIAAPTSHIEHGVLHFVQPI